MIVASVLFCSGVILVVARSVDTQRFLNPCVAGQFLVCWFCGDRVIVASVLFCSGVILGCGWVC